MSATTSPLVARWDAIRQDAFGSVTSSYTPIGSIVAHAVRILKIVNTTNQDVYVSFDGVTDNDYVPATSIVLYDMDSDLLALQVNTQIYVRNGGTNPTSGNVTIACIYARGQ